MSGSECPHCEAAVSPQAQVCPKCGEDLFALTPPAPDDATRRPGFVGCRMAIGEARCPLPATVSDSTRRGVSWCSLHGNHSARGAETVDGLRELQRDPSERLAARRSGTTIGEDIARMSAEQFGRQSGETREQWLERLHAGGLPRNFTGKQLPLSRSDGQMAKISAKPDGTANRMRLRARLLSGYDLALKSRGVDESARQLFCKILADVMDPVLGIRNDKSDAA